MQIWLSALAVAVGGALGALARIGLAEMWGFSLLVDGVLISTFAVNIIGSLALGILRGMPRPPLPPELFAGLTVGFLGGFTTWSAVVDQTVNWAGQSLGGALGYLLATVVGGIAAAWWGLSLGARFQGVKRESR